MLYSFPRHQVWGDPNPAALAAGSVIADIGQMVWPMTFFEKSYGDYCWSSRPIVATAGGWQVLEDLHPGSEAARQILVDILFEPERMKLFFLEGEFQNLARRDVVVRNGLGTREEAFALMKLARVNPVAPWHGPGSSFGGVVWVRDQLSLVTDIHQTPPYWGVMYAPVETKVLEAAGIPIPGKPPALDAKGKVVREAPEHDVLIEAFEDAEGK